MCILPEIGRSLKKSHPLTLPTLQAPQKKKTEAHGAKAFHLRSISTTRKRNVIHELVMNLQ